MTPDPGACEVCGAPTQLWALDDRATLVRCTACGHLGRSLAMAPADSRDGQYSDGPGDGLRAVLTDRRLRRRTDLPVPARIVDLGCGPQATLGRRLAARGHDVVGIDPSLAQDDVGTVRVGAGRLTLVRGDVADLHGEGFDLVSAIHVVEHVDDLAGTLEAVRGALRPGGAFYAITPDGATAQLPRFGSDWWMLEDPTHVRFLTPRSAVLALREAGFVDVRPRRLITDSLGSDAGTVLRHLRHSSRGGRGALGPGPATAASAALLPLTVAVRAASPRWRPVLDVVARTPSG